MTSGSVQQIHDKFHRDPARSYTLSGRYYWDADIYARERDAIFHRTWQFAGHVSSIANPGDYMVRDILGESIIVMRGRDGELKAYYNVCQHRAHQLLKGEGNVKAFITCPYHAWAYDLDGNLRSARASERVDGFDKAEFCLSKVRIETLAGFIFINLDANAEPLQALAIGLEDDLRRFSPEPENLTLAYSHTYDIKANWKNIIENYCECYHCPASHPSFADGVVDMNSYRIKVNDLHHTHTSKSGAGDPLYDYDAGRGSEFVGLFIWPNVAIEVYPGGNLNVFHNMPTGPETTLQTIEWYFADAQPTPEEQQIIDYMHETVRPEDVVIVESVQEGLRSKGYGQGRFIVDTERTDISEHAVHDFQLRVRQALDEPVPD